MDTRKIKFVSILCACTLALASKPAIAQLIDLSVQIPNAIQEEIVELNSLISEFETESMTLNQALENLVEEYKHHLKQVNNNKLKNIEEQRIAERAANIRAQIQQIQLEFLTQINAITDEIITVTDRIQKIELNTEELESVSSITKEYSQRLLMIDAKIRRGSLLALYANHSENISTSMDQLTAQYDSLLEMSNQQVEDAQLMTEKLINYIYIFESSIQDQMSFLERQAESINKTSDMILERIKVARQLEMKNECLNL